MEDWFWIVILAFFLLRLVLRAAKKKAGTEQRRGPEFKESPQPEGEGLNELHEFLDRLAGRPPGERPPAPPPPPPRMAKRPPPPPSSPKTVRKVKVDAPAAPPPVKVPVTFQEPREEIDPLSFSSNPLIQGIIFSELLGPPKGLRESPGLPSDPAG